jgi:hypothetical protein
MVAGAAQGHVCKEAVIVDYSYAKSPVQSSANIGANIGVGRRLDGAGASHYTSALHPHARFRIGKSAAER